MQYKINAPISERYRLTVIVHLLLWVLLVLLVAKQTLLPAFVTKAPFGISDTNGIVNILDFPSHFNFAKAFWLSTRFSGNSVYSVSNHLQVTSAWAAEDLKQCLSFGYSPTMLWLLAPLVSLSHATAFCMFNALGLLAVWWQTRPGRCRFGLGLLAYFSVLSQVCFHLGQTAILTGAGLLFLFEESRKGFERLISRETISSAFVLWALTAKPPLALTAGVVLLGLRQWRPVLFAVLLFVVTTLIISPYLGPGWLSDYLHLIASYNRVEADPAFAWGFYPPHMASLRGVLAVDCNLADNLASCISSFVWIFALVCLGVAGSRMCLTVGGTWACGVLLYFLFCPHVTSTELLQTSLLLTFCTSPNNKNMSYIDMVLVFTVPLLPLASPLQLDNRIILFFVLLCLLLFLSVCFQEKASAK